MISGSNSIVSTLTVLFILQLLQWSSKNYVIGGSMGNKCNNSYEDPKDTLGITMSVLFLVLFVFDLVIIVIVILTCCLKHELLLRLIKYCAKRMIGCRKGCRVIILKWRQSEPDNQQENSHSKDATPENSCRGKATLITSPDEESKCGIYDNPSDETPHIESQEIYQNVTRESITEQHLSDYINQASSEPKNSHPQAHSSSEPKSALEKKVTKHARGIKVEEKIPEEYLQQSGIPAYTNASSEEKAEALYWEPTGSAGDITTKMIETGFSEIQPLEIALLERLGEGEFGEVYKATWSATHGKYDVAVKQLKWGGDKKQLVKEAAIMGQFGHPYVVQMLGISAINTHQASLVMEYLANGDLRSFLLTLKTKLNERKVKESSLTHKFLKYCTDISNAMSYLHQKGFIHRDLAARNILMADEDTCKIADFGMSHELEEEYYYKSKGGQIPLKWTAPEAIFYKKYTTKSDVWSYGMVMYEIWSLGRKPFEDYPPDKVIQSLNQKYSQPPPPGCPRGIYQIMIQCWNPDPHERPTLRHVFEKFCLKSETLLKWDKKDKTGPKVSTLGAPIEYGAKLYKDLAATYI